ncbi:hypothetical protein Pmar_PMAR012499 [Perkinsus marinus ATCC 50983]|uniref:Uncharacterized protein n=1 Tax=Perkinsus marinus (strain ATCC 50983 / TXsc) TaxID=423536 RepID=C5K7I4_PERM5|nr:hypothetical protein Pmar_PMAR012499 [Perkinsus marinus ATCC 50983]EER19518.1 hypothetical protein Pmar_PMAR012499 [Perkinsus marinus ATCC 50983]|eukprot:XP_002787722.1 hypothetical protein Pmar_PMAR012499 [Perkinsus marinus ATCC 50983]
MVTECHKFLSSIFAWNTHSPAASEGTIETRKNHRVRLQCPPGRSTKVPQATMMIIRATDYNAAKRCVPGHVKEEMLRHRTLDLMESAQATHERNTRWGDKLRASPFATNLVMQLEHAQHLAEERELADKREAREEYIRHRDKRNMMFKKAVADSDLVCMLRREKRLLLENERRLAAACTVERTNAKVDQILEERRQKEIEMQERLLRRTISP